MDKKSILRKKLPDKPGVYFFLGKNKKILYIGKATSIKNRITSYFGLDIVEKRSNLIEKMVQEAISIDYTETDSVVEALILESNLIRSHKPYYNTKSKDDKTYNHLIITNEEWPRLLIVRESDLTEKFSPEDIKYQFGPFPNGSLFKEALRIIRKLFKYYDSKNSVGEEKTKIERGRIDFNRQIGLYPSLIGRSEYLKTILHIKLFFEGKKSKIILDLEKEMSIKAKLQKFEEANEIKKRIFALKHIEDIALIKIERNMPDVPIFRIEAYDIAHHAGKDMVGVMVVIQNSEAKKSEYRKFKIKTLKSANDPAALTEVLERRFCHQEWAMPDLIVVDGNLIQINAAVRILSKLMLEIPVLAVTKDKSHKPIKIVPESGLALKYKYEILMANAEAHRFAINYYRNLNRKTFLKSSK